MWIQGRRRGGAKNLVDHLRKTDENESVAVREIEGFTLSELTGTNLDSAIRQMEAIGYGKGAKRNLFHTIIAPAYGETLNAKQQKMMVDYYAEQMGFKGHQYAVVEHWKKGKQHFHLVFNIIDPVTGKIHELKWSKKNEWRISRDLEKILGLSTLKPKGKASNTWETQRGRRTGTDPSKMRKEVTAIFLASKTAQEFIAALDKAGYALTHGRKGQLVLIDKFGDTHGLMRRIEGKTLADLRQKFTGIEQIKFQSHAELVRTRQAATGQTPNGRKHYYKKAYTPVHRHHVRKHVKTAYHISKTGKVFVASLHQKSYRLGKGVKGYAVIDRNGDRHELHILLGRLAIKGLNKKFPDLAALHLQPASNIIRRVKAKKRIGGNNGNASTGSKRIFAPAIPSQPINASAKKTSRTSQAHRSDFIKSVRATIQANRIAKASEHIRQQITPVKASCKGWPEAALIDWQSWGKKNPPRFFAKWPELAPDGYSPSGGLSL